MNDPLVVPRRAILVQQSLHAAGIATAIGGALALAYHVEDPRATRDIDLNLMIPRTDALRGLQALPAGPQWGQSELTRIYRDGQVRLYWDISGQTRMPLDLFFAEHDFHYVAAQRTQKVPLLDADIHILSATDLVVFKTIFDRRKDWADIEEVLRFGPPSFDLAEALRWLVAILGTSDRRISSLRAIAAECS